MGAGAGNTPTEVLAAVCDQAGIETGIDPSRPWTSPRRSWHRSRSAARSWTAASLLLGYAGVYSSFLLHAERAAERFGVSDKEILLEVGRRKAVGGQEDMIIEVAAELAAAREPVEVEVA